MPHSGKGEETVYRHEYLGEVSLPRDVKPVVKSGLDLSSGQPETVVFAGVNGWPRHGIFGRGFRFMRSVRSVAVDRSRFPLDEQVKYKYEDTGKDCPGGHCASCYALGLKCRKEDGGSK